MIIMDSQFKTVLLVSVPNQPPMCYHFDRNRIQIGRSKYNHLRIDDNAISKVHCEIVKRPDTDQWIFRDLGSTNGSNLNGKPVGWDVIVVDQADEIVLGKVIKLRIVSVRPLEVPEEEDEASPDVNPVAAAVARQSREDMEGTQLIKLPHRKK